MSCVFYDLETSGISPDFDQRLQFAPIWTVENVLEKARVSVLGCLAPQILPSPCVQMRHR